MKKEDDTLLKFNKKFRYDFWKHFESFAVQESENILVAVSGGVDSMCLLNLLYDLSFIKDSPDYPNFNLAIAHVNFSLRGKESDADEALVRDWASKHSITLHVKKFDTEEYAKKHSLSIEMAARDLRYDWFYSLMLKHKYNYLAIAHNANDNAETILLNLVRGTGIKGLQGIREKRDVYLKDYTFGFSIIRPLLIFRRSDIQEYADRNNIGYREDKSNGDIAFARNRIRHNVMPELEKINSAAIKTLNRDITYFTMVSDIVGEIAEKKAKEISVGYTGIEGTDYLGLRKEYMTAAISAEKLMGEKHSSYWLFEMLQNYGFNVTQIEDITEQAKLMVEKLRSDVAEKNAAESGSFIPVGNTKSLTTKLFVSDDFVLATERGYLKIYYKSVLDAVPDRVLDDFSDFYEFSWGRLKIHLRVADYNAGISETEKGLFLDADKVHYPLSCRKLKDGDKFSPYGLKGSKSVADFLNGKKVDAVFKEKIPIISSGSRILLIPGIEIDDSCKITSSTKRVLIVDIRN